MRTNSRPPALLALLAACLLPACNANEGGEGALAASYELRTDSGQVPLDDAPLEVCCEDGIVAMLAVGQVAVTDADGEIISDYFPSQFDELSPVPGVRYLGFSLADVDPPGSLAFRWDGPFVADLHRDENSNRDLMPFDPDVDVGEPLSYVPPPELSALAGYDSYNILEVSAARCDFERASFTMIVFEFSYLANPTQGAGIAVYRSRERTVEIVNECYVPPPPPPAGADMIVFSNKRPGEDTEIWVIDAAGGGATQLTDNTREDWDPAWSPDRSQIAFVSNSQGGGASLDLMVMDFDATGAGTPEPYTNFLGVLSARDPAWSPAPGVRKVAVAVGAQGYFDRIQIFDLTQPAGSPPIEISTLPQREIEHLAWSPAGDQIAYSNAGTIYKVSTVTPGAPTVVNSVQDWSLDWSATGLVMQRYSNSHPGRMNIVRADGNGDGVISVTTLGAQETYSDATPSWSPLSDRIVFVRKQSEASFGRLRIVHRDGTNNIEIAGQPTGSNTEPDWGFGPLP